MHEDLCSLIADTTLLDFTICMRCVKVPEIPRDARGSSMSPVRLRITCLARIGSALAAQPGLQEGLG